MIRKLQLIILRSGKSKSNICMKLLRKELKHFRKMKVSYRRKLKKIYRMILRSGYRRIKRKYRKAQRKLKKIYRLLLKARRAAARRKRLRLARRAMMAGHHIIVEGVQPHEHKEDGCLVLSILEKQYKKYKKFVMRLKKRVIDAKYRTKLRVKLTPYQRKLRLIQKLRNKARMFKKAYLKAKKGSSCRNLLRLAYLEMKRMSKRLRKQLKH